VNTKSTVVICAILLVLAVVGLAQAAPPAEPTPCDCTFVVDATDNQSGVRIETTINLQDIIFVQRPTETGTGFTLRFGSALMTIHSPTPEAAQATYQSLTAAMDTCLCNC